METKAEEMYNLQKYFGFRKVNLILGDFTSYKLLRELHTYQEIFNEINNLIK